MERYTKATRLANFDHPRIAALVRDRRWRLLPCSQRIGAVHEFVRNEIPFGYNRRDDSTASEVLREGLGQCNTKSTLLLALLRAVEIPCRVRGMKIDKALQRGALGPLTYALAPRQILHSWVEVRHEGRWLALEGVIIDAPYLAAVQQRFPTAIEFTGYGVATADLRAPRNQWRGAATYIQRQGVVVDHGPYDDPDELFRTLGTNLGWATQLVWTGVFRHPLNRRVRRLRGDANATTPDVSRSPGTSCCAASGHCR